MGKFKHWTFWLILFSVTSVITVPFNPIFFDISWNDNENRL